MIPGVLPVLCAASELARSSAKMTRCDLPDGAVFPGCASDRCPAPGGKNGAATSDKGGSVNQLETLYRSVGPGHLCGCPAGVSAGSERSRSGLGMSVACRGRCDTGWHA